MKHQSARKEDGAAGRGPLRGLAGWSLLARWLGAGVKSAGILGTPQRPRDEWAALSRAGPWRSEVRRAQQGPAGQQPVLSHSTQLSRPQTLSVAPLALTRSAVRTWVGNSVRGLLT